MLNRTLRALYHFTVYAVGIIVLLAAVTVTMLRLLLPDIGQYRSEIEAWGSRHMGFPLVIRSLDASWQGWIPNLNLGDIDLLNKAGTESVIHFHSAQVKIDPIATLLKRQLVPRRLVVSGFDLSVTRQSNGAITIQGINIENNEQKTDKNELAEWLFNQSRIELQNARITWIDQAHEQTPLLLTDVDFTLKTDATRIQLQGSAKLPLQYGKRLHFAFDAYGDLLSSAWSGELYLSAKGINPDSWYRKYRPHDLSIAGGNADIELWSTWANAKLATLEGELAYKDFAALTKGSRLHVEKLSGHFRGQGANHDDWRLHINLDQLITENGAWPETKVFIASRSNKEDETPSFDVAFNWLKLDDLMPLITNLPGLPKQTKNHLAKLSLHGQLHDGRIHFDPHRSDASRLLYDVGFSELTANLGARLPAFTGLSGRMYGKLNSGVLKLSGADPGEINFPAFYQEKLPLSTLNGALNWKYDGTAWQVNTQSIELKTDNISLRLAGRVWGADNLASPFVDLRAELDKGKLEKVVNYFPETKKLKIKNWMERSILGGELDSASAVIRGQLADFPFHDHSGQFKTLVNISDGVLEYSKRWPIVDNIDAEILFSGKEMLAKFHRGNIFKADIIKATAYIGDIKTKKKSIIIDGQIKGQARDATLFVQQSPLKQNSVLDQLSNLFTQGSAILDVKLNVPLKRGKKNIDLLGKLALNDAHIVSDVKNLALRQIQGELEFTKSTTSSHNLTATFAGQPVKLSVSRNTAQTDQLASITISGHSDQDFVISQLIRHAPALSSRESWLAEKLSGEIDWLFGLHYAKGAAENEIIQSFTIDSDLVGLAIDLPEPVGKSKQSIVPVKLYRQLGIKENSTLIINYGANLSAKFLFATPTELKNIQLHFGEKEIARVVAGTGLFITGKIDALDFSEWWSALQFGKNKQGKSFISENNITIDIETNVLTLFGQQFADVDILGLRSNFMWNFSLSAEEITGAIAMPVKWERDSLLTFDLDTLHLKKSKRLGAEKKPVDPRLVPGLEVKIKDFFYNDKLLGETLLSVSPIEDGFSIDQFSFNKPAMNIQGEGNWKQEGRQHSSNFHIELNAKNMNAMLRTFDYDATAIKKGATNLVIDANWAGTPTDFSLDKLNGSLSMRIKKGRLLEVGPSAGRLFGLLSIQTLPRRLSLDFTDLFKKGLAFDRIAGNFEITNGNAYTNDLFMDGPSADVAVTGRTGLSVQDYDQIVTVTPQITGNLPVAGAIFGPVGIGVGAILYFASQMFESTNSNINKLLRHQYTITGHWNEPVIEKLKANTEKETSS